MVLFRTELNTNAQKLCQTRALNVKTWEIEEVILRPRHPPNPQIKPYAEIWWNEQGNGMYKIAGFDYEFKP